MSETKRCPKCDGVMERCGRISGYADFPLRILVKEKGSRDDTVFAFYCTRCGYIELYKEKA